MMDSLRPESLAMIHPNDSGDQMIFNVSQLVGIAGFPEEGEVELTVTDADGAVLNVTIPHTLLLPLAKVLISEAAEIQEAFEERTGLAPYTRAQSMEMEEIDGHLRVTLRLEGGATDRFVVALAGRSWIDS
jgi:hypothetical protein